MKTLYDALDHLEHGDRVIASLFVGGAVGGALMALIGPVLQGRLDPAFVAVYALLGAAILPIAELASRPASSWWAKGLLFGTAAGVLAGLSSHALFAEDPLLTNLFATTFGSIAGALVWKYFSPLEKKARKNDTAAGAQPPPGERKARRNAR